MGIRVTRISTFKEGYNPAVINFLFDASYSMNKVKSIIAQCITSLILPALSKADERKRAAVRLALAAFSETIQKLTAKPGYSSINELKRMEPIPVSRLYAPGLDGNTALYQALIDGINHAVEAGYEVMKMLGIRKIKVEVVCLTDGENTVKGYTEADVRRKIESLKGGPIDLKVCLAYFKTDADITRAEFESIGKACGIPKGNLHFWADHGESDEEQQRAFRKLIEVLSRESMQNAMRQ